MKRYDRYVLRSFLQHWVVVAAAFLCLFTVMDVLLKTDDLSRASERFHSVGYNAFRFYILNLPYLLLQFAPYITLLAGLGSVLQFQKNREWLPALTGGRPTWRAFLPLFIAASAIALTLSGVREVVIPKVGMERAALSYKLFSQREWRPVDLWARGSAGERLHARFFSPGPPSKLLGLEVYSPQGSSESLLEAKSATWKNGKWHLVNGREFRLGQENDLRDWAPESFSPSDLARAWFMQNEPLELSVGDYSQISAVDPGHRLAATLYWSTLFSPFAHLILLFLGLPFALRFERRASTEGIAVGLLLCALYFVAEFLFRDLGGRGTLSPGVAGAAPILLFGALAMRVQHRLPT